MTDELNKGTSGPDQGDPAAWAWLNPDGVPCGFTTAKVQADAWRENGGVTRNVVPLDVRAAPGAVAAAPPGDEDDDATEAVLDMAGAVLLTDAPLSVRAAAQRVAVLIEVEGWRLAPPAGHEDEAAVERVTVDTDDLRTYLDESTPADTDGAFNASVALRAALAVARGPRTPDLEL